MLGQVTVAIVLTDAGIADTETPAVVATEGRHGPSDALRAEIAFIARGENGPHGVQSHLSLR